MVESVANCKSNPYEVISTEDLLARVHECNLMVERKRRGKLEAGEPLTDEDLLVMIGFDAIALFPSLKSARTGQIARRQVEKSEITFEGADYMEMSRYAALNREKITGELGTLERLLPRRRKVGWKVPGMQNPEIKGKEKNTQITWVFPDRTPTEQEKKKLHGIVIEIVIRTLFDNFVYTFGGENYLQLEGGPIGCRITMAVSRLVMQDWAVHYRLILERSALTIWLYGGYVDDGRQGTSLLKKGMRFEEESRSLTFSEEALTEDNQLDEEDEVRMSRVLLPAMNSINPDIQYTTETSSDFPSKWLPSWTPS